MLVEADTVLERLFAPPGADDVEREAAIADAVDVGGLLGKERWVVEGGTDGDHQLQLLGNGCESRGGRPGIKRRSLGALDVVEVELGDQGAVVAEGFGVKGEIANVVPGGWHLLIFDVAKPTAEDG